jgi:hypothetical protein
VLIGYIHGVAVVLVISQLGKIFGLDLDERNLCPSSGKISEPRHPATTLAVGVAYLPCSSCHGYSCPVSAALLVVTGDRELGIDLADHGVRALAVEAGHPARHPDSWPVTY